jgi:hypothetical protein
MEAEPPDTLFILDLATKKMARSKMKAVRATVAANPDMQLLKQVIAISRTWASRPKMAATPARPKATICRTRAYVSHFTTTVGIWRAVLSPTKALMLSSYPTVALEHETLPEISEQYPKVPNVM